jgi:hypothetical protein
MYRGNDIVSKTGVLFCFLLPSSAGTEIDLEDLNVNLKHYLSCCSSNIEGSKVGYRR